MFTVRANSTVYVYILRGLIHNAVDIHISPKIYIYHVIDSTTATRARLVNTSQTSAGRGTHRQASANRLYPYYFVR